MCASSAGLGKGCAVALAEAGVSLVLNGRDRAALEATAQEIRSGFSVDVIAIAGDIGTPEGQAAVLAACPDPDILINNNGGPPCRDFRELDRAAMRRRIISDKDARKELEAILHPLILQAVQQQLQTIPKVPYVLIVIPLLVETGSYRNLLDRVLVVDCLETQQITRIMARNAMSAAEAEAILAAQTRRATRLEVADDTLINTGDVASLHAQIPPLHHKYLQISRKAL